MSEDIKKVLDARGNDYGNFDTHAIRTQAAERALDVPDTLHPVYKEAIHMILHKLGRAVNGRACVRDHWIDIAGYAQLVVKYIDKQYPMRDPRSIDELTDSFSLGDGVSDSVERDELTDNLLVRDSVHPPYSKNLSWDTYKEYKGL